LCAEKGEPPPLALHLNHRLRGLASDEDQRFVETLAESLGFPLVVERVEAAGNGAAPGLEERAREQRYAFLKKSCEARGIRRLLVAHTADDQVETILMRFFEGSGITGLKGIPRSGEGGVERPLLDVWRSEIIQGLETAGHAWRLDESNADIRFERNWLRNILIPLLVQRYGAGVTSRIHLMGERFRELDDFIRSTATRWIRRNLRGNPPSFRRPSYSRLPSPVRIAVLYRLVLDHAGKAANERLLGQLDRTIVDGSPSAAIRAGGKLRFQNNYEIVSLVPGESNPFPDASNLGKSREALPNSPGVYHWGGPVPLEIRITEVSPAVAAKRMKAFAEQSPWTVYFDPGKILFPLSIGPLVKGDAVTPFGGKGRRKVKEIMIDRKVPRAERWGRGVVRDANGDILWIPGLCRSETAPVIPGTRKLLCLSAHPLC
jgi:tRNA(Ile)-lysidine synthase